MKTSRFTETRIVAILKQADSGRAVKVVGDRFAGHGRFAADPE